MQDRNRLNDGSSNESQYGCKVTFSSDNNVVDIILYAEKLFRVSPQPVTTLAIRGGFSKEIWFVII